MRLSAWADIIREVRGLLRSGGINRHLYRHQPERTIRKSLKGRGSSLVERRPEKAGVASSILAPGTTRSRHRFVSKEIYFAMCKIHWFAVLYRWFEYERPEVFCKYCPRKINAFGMRD